MERFYLRPLHLLLIDENRSFSWRFPAHPGIPIRFQRSYEILSFLSINKHVSKMRTVGLDLSSSCQTQKQFISVLRQRKRRIGELKTSKLSISFFSSIQTHSCQKSGWDWLSLHFMNLVALKRKKKKRRIS